MHDGAMTTPNPDLLHPLLSLRQSRRFLPRKVAQADLERLLEVARWTGSAKNVQPWHLVVVTDADTNQALADCGDFSGFLSGVAASIVVAVEGDHRAVAYDDGRLQERVMLAASALGIGSGLATLSLGRQSGWVTPTLHRPRQRRNCRGANRLRRSLAGTDTVREHLAEVSVVATRCEAEGSV